MPTLDLTNTAGALLIGVVFSTTLYGITILQAFMYFQNYGSDSLLIKGSVCALLVLETLHSIFGVHVIYFYLVTNYMNPEKLNVAVWSATMTLLCSTVLILLVHLFYIRRIYVVSGNNRVLTFLLLVLAFAHFGIGMVLEIKSFELAFFSSFGPDINKIADSSLTLSAAVDILIAGSLSYYLHRSRSGIRSTDTIINKLMIYTINNSILTSVFDIIVLAFAVAEKDLRYLAIYQVVGNLYTNSMLATLNSRNSLRAGARHVNVADGSSLGVPMSTFRAGNRTATVLGDVDDKLSASGSEFDKAKALEVTVASQNIRAYDRA